MGIIIIEHHIYYYKTFHFVINLVYFNYLLYLYVGVFNPFEILFNSIRNDHIFTFFQDRLNAPTL
jgi:hypothetical protein